MLQTSPTLSSHWPADSARKYFRESFQNRHFLVRFFGQIAISFRGPQPRRGRVPLSTTQTSSRAMSTTNMPINISAILETLIPINAYRPMTYRNQKPVPPKTFFKLLAPPSASSVSPLPIRGQHLHPIPALKLSADPNRPNSANNDHQTSCDFPWSPS